MSPAKMVANFRRSLSFPNHPSSSHSSSSKPRKTFHVRSTSLPCRSHPLISFLKDHLRELVSWGSHPSPRTLAWLSLGLTRLRTVLDYLDDLLQLPQTQDSLLRHHSRWIENLLDDLLRFVDVYGIFQTLILALKQEHSAAQVAIRRRDDSKIALYVKAVKKLTNEMGQLASAVRTTGAFPALTTQDGDAELAQVIRDVYEATVLVSAALFNGVSLPFAAQKSWWEGLWLAKRSKRSGRAEEGIQQFQAMGRESLWGLRKKGDEEVRMVLKRMQELEDCIAEIEVCSERVFRSLINTRVSLLNVLTK